MAEKPHKHYTVIETANISAEELQKILNEATKGFPEKQIEHVIETKIILSHESMLTAKGRAEAHLTEIINSNTGEINRY